MHIFMYECLFTTGIKVRNDSESMLAATRSKMAHVFISLMGLLTIGEAIVNIPSYTETFTAFSKSINTLLEPSATSTHSKLIEGLYDVGKATTLTPEQNTTYYQFVDDLETNVINNSFITNDTIKLFNAGKAISFFNVTQPQVFALVNQKNITGWSTLSNFVSITNSYNLQTVLNMIVKYDVPIPFDGVTNFFFEVVYALQKKGLTEETTAFYNFYLTDIQPSVLDTTISEKTKWAIIYANMVSYFFPQDPTWYNKFMQLDLGKYGSFYQVLQNALIFFTDVRMPNLVLGDVLEWNGFLYSIDSSIVNMTLPYPNVVRGQIRQFYKALVKDFNNTTTLEGRLASISKWYGTFIGLQWNYYTWLQYVGYGNFGNLNQLITYIGIKNIVGTIPEYGVLTAYADVTPG